jgi:hypothetical protein
MAASVSAKDAKNNKKEVPKVDTTLESTDSTFSGRMK